MADVKHWDLFPTKVFESKFVATKEILEFVSNNYNKSSSNLVKQSHNNDLHRAFTFEPFVKQVYDVTKHMCEVYEYEYNEIDITSM